MAPLPLVAFRVVFNTCWVCSPLKELLSFIEFAAEGKHGEFWACACHTKKEMKRRIAQMKTRARQILDESDVQAQCTQCAVAATGRHQAPIRHQADLVSHMSHNLLPGYWRALHNISIAMQALIDSHGHLHNGTDRDLLFLPLKDFRRTAESYIGSLQKMLDAKATKALRRSDPDDLRRKIDERRRRETEYATCPASRDLLWEREVSMEAGNVVDGEWMETEGFVGLFDEQKEKIHLLLDNFIHARGLVPASKALAGDCIEYWASRDPRSRESRSSSAVKLNAPDG